MNLEDSADAVTDHRIALMQKWAADPKLMAQVGLLQGDADEHLGVKIPGIDRLRAISRLAPRQSKTPVTHADSDPQMHPMPANDKKKKKKKSKKAASAAIHDRLKNMTPNEKVIAYHLLMETHGIHVSDHKPNHQK